MLDNGWVFPRITRPPHLRVSEATQKAMVEAWQKLVEEEKAWWIKIAEIAEKRRGLPPGTIIANLEPKLYREALRRGGPKTPDKTEPSLAMVKSIEAVKVLVPGVGAGSTKNDRREEDKAEQKKSTPQQQNPPPLNRPNGENEEKEKRRKLREEREHEEQQGLAK